MSPETAAEDLVFILTSKGLDPSNGQYIKERKPLQPSRNARNDDLATKLWALSCELTDLSWE
jgi:hypothetical protein